MKFLVFAALVAVVAADSAYPAYQKPAYSAPGYQHKAYDYPARPYNFGYDVNDDYTYTRFGQQETSDGKAVSGYYRVHLPDGRIQTINYKADEYGNVADVKYEGEAKVYDYKPAYKSDYAAPAYKDPAYTAPAYKADYVAPAYTTEYSAPAYKADYSAPAYKADYAAPAYKADYVAPDYKSPAYKSPVYPTKY